MVRNAAWMELQGLIELFDWLDSQGINVEAFVSDRHNMIAAYMKTSRETVLHVFDIWHVAKGMNIKITDKLCCASPCGFASRKVKSKSNQSKSTTF